MGRLEAMSHIPALGRSSDERGSSASTGEVARPTGLPSQHAQLFRPLSATSLLRIFYTGYLAATHQLAAFGLSFDFVMRPKIAYGLSATYLLPFR